jgi:hypothetical protein
VCEDFALNISTDKRIIVKIRCWTGNMEKAKHTDHEKLKVGSFKYSENKILKKEQHETEL